MSKNKPTCENCKWASQPTDRTVLWCSIKRSVAPTWSTCEEHKYKDAEEDKEE